MLETSLLLATMPVHLGVPLADLVAWALVLAFLAAPVANDTATTQKIFEIGGARPRRAAAGHQSDTAPERVSVAALASAVPSRAVTIPATARLSVADQWQTMSRLVSDGADRVMAVAREQQSIRRELDSLDLTIENMRRELAAVMSMTVPATRRSAELVAIPLRSRPGALAA